MCNSNCNSVSRDVRNCDVSGTLTLALHDELLPVVSDSFHYPREILNKPSRGVTLVTAGASRDPDVPPEAGVQGRVEFGGCCTANRYERRLQQEASNVVHDGSWDEPARFR